MKRTNTTPESIKNVTFKNGEINIYLVEASISCQRPINKTRVNQIFSEWNSGFANPLKINSLPGGTFRIVDGQHTVAAYKMRLERGLESNAAYPCIYAYNLTREQENDWLLYEDGKYAPQPNSTKVKANIDAGNKDLLSRINLCEKYGYSVRYSNTKGLKIGCIDTLLEIPESILDKTLSAVSTAYPNNSKAVQAKFLKGVSTFVGLYEDSIDLERLVTKLRTTLPEAIITASNSGSGEKKMLIPRVLYDLYNKGLKKDNRLDVAKLF